MNLEEERLLMASTALPGSGQSRGEGILKSQKHTRKGFATSPSGFFPLQTHGDKQGL